MKHNQITCEVELRSVAILLSKHLPVEGIEFSECVESTLKSLKRLSPEARLAMRTAYIFASKVPRDEQEDFYQELVLALLKAKTRDEKLAYAIARFDWLDWWRKFKVKQHYVEISLDAPIRDNQSEAEEVQLSEVLVGECEFENKMNGKLEAERIWNLLPMNIQAIVAKRLQGRAIPAVERKQLSRWINSHPMQLATICS